MHYLYCMLNKAQGTIEYLVIIGIVVVLSLVVVGIISSMGGGSASSISSTTGKISQASGSINITEAVIDSNGRGFIFAGNNTGAGLTITGINVDGVVVDSTDTVWSSFGDGGFLLENLGDACSCVGFVGKNRTCEIIFYGRSEFGIDHNYKITTTVTCLDKLNLVDETKAIIPEVLNPVVSLVGPADGNLTRILNNIFIFTLKSADVNVTDCNLKINSNVDANHIYLGSLVSTDTNYSIKYSLPSEADYNWNVTCYATNGLTGTGALDRNISFRANLPAVSLSSPMNQTITYSNPTTFAYTVTDDYGVNDCNLLINGNVVATDNVAPFDSFSLDLSLGRYDWNVLCGNIFSKQSSSRADLNVFTSFNTNFFFYKNGWPSSTIKKISYATGTVLSSPSISAVDWYHSFYLDPDRNVVWIPYQSGGSGTPNFVVRIDSITGAKLSQTNGNCPDIYRGVVDRNGNAYFRGGWSNDRRVCKFNSSGTNVLEFLVDAGITGGIDALTVDSNGNLWIPEMSASGPGPSTTIEKINPNTGATISTFEAVCTTSINSAGFLFDSLGYLWIDCGGSNKVFKYDTSGNKLLELSKNVSRITVDNNGGAYLLTSDANIIKVNSIDNSTAWNVPLGYADSIGHFFFQPVLDSGELVLGRATGSNISRYNASTGAFIGTWTSGNTQGATTPDPNGLYYWISAGKK